MSSEKNINNLSVPAFLCGNPLPRTEAELVKLENEIMAYFTENSELFTPYASYFKTRCYEFRVLRQLLPEYLGLGVTYENGLEIGCGYGYRTLFLARLCQQLVGTDIPENYKGYIRGAFETSVDIAECLVRKKFNPGNVAFHKLWPGNLSEIKDASIDFAFSEYVFEHIEDLPEAIHELSRVMKPGGVMIHVVPTTKSAIKTFINAQVQLPAKTFIKEVFRKLLRKGQIRMRLNGTVVPRCHSQFIDDFSQQLEIYSIENYTSPMLEAGFEIKKILSTRESNNVIVAQKAAA